MDFKNTILILTSNLGSEYILNGINADGTIEESAREQVRALLRPPSGRFPQPSGRIVFYKPLTKENVTKIIDLQICQAQRPSGRPADSLRADAGSQGCHCGRGL